MRQAGNNAGFYRVGRDGDNRGIPRCLLRGQCAGDVEGYDHINLEPDKFCREPGKSIRLSFRRAKIECDVLALNVTKFTQSFPKICFKKLSVSISQVKGTHPRNFSLLSV